MKKILSKSHWLIAKHGISLVAVFAMLVVAFVAIAPDLSFGWFSQNNQVSAKGMTVQAEHPDFDVYYRAAGATDWTLIDISNPSDIAVTNQMQSPGASVTFEVKIVNKSQRAIAMQAFGFAAPTSTEEVANAAGVYLSTELYTTLLAINGTDVADNKTFLRPSTAMDAPGAVGAVNILGTNSVTLAANNGEVVFSVKMTFNNRTEVVDGEERDVNQNVFKHFGVDGDGTCQRRLYFTYNELNS